MTRKPPNIPLPETWSSHIKSGILHVISLARIALVAASGRAAQSRKAHIRLRAELAEARREISQLEEELRLEDLRMSRVRPRYRAVERMAILELRAARGWSRRQTARRFLLQPATVAAWTKRVDEGGERALLETPEPVNRLPHVVRYIVRRLKVLCPSMGKKRIAQTLARAGLALGVSTVGRILKERETERPEPDENVAAEAVGDRHVGKPVQAAKPNDVCQIDLTVVPTAAGFWTAWFPFAVEQSWPFAWWAACVVDHYSRCVMGFAVFSKEPKSIDIRRFLGRVAAKVDATPRYIIADKGRQFDCRDYRAWCERRGIRPRYASTGSLRATAVVERFIRSLKDEWLRRIRVPLRRDAMRRDLDCDRRWFESHRSHQGIDGRTPGEVYNRTESPRPKVDAKCPLELVVHFHEGRTELPIVELKNAA